jgi:hypothetical protein
MWRSNEMKRPYPHKPDSERRIVISFSVSGLMLKLFREKLAESMHIRPEEVSQQDMRSQVRQLALNAIEDYNAGDVPVDSEYASERTKCGYDVT